MATHNPECLKNGTQRPEFTAFSDMQEGSPRVLLESLRIICEGCPEFNNGCSSDVTKWQDTRKGPTRIWHTPSSDELPLFRAGGVMRLEDGQRVHHSVEVRPTTSPAVSIAVELLQNAEMDTSTPMLMILSAMIDNPVCWQGRGEVLNDLEWRSMLSSLSGSSNDDKLAGLYMDVCSSLHTAGILDVRTTRKEAGKIINGTQYCYNPASAGASKKQAGESASSQEQEEEANWQDDANCLGVDPDLFFPERGASTREAKEVCRGCVVRRECLEFALENVEKFGIWGGLSERERRRLRRIRSQAARSV